MRSSCRQPYAAENAHARLHVSILFFTPSGRTKRLAAAGRVPAVGRPGLVGHGNLEDSAVDVRLRPLDEGISRKSQRPN